MKAEEMKMDPAAFDAAVADGTLADHPYLPILHTVRQGAAMHMIVPQTPPGQEAPAFDLPETYKGVTLSLGDDTTVSYGPAGFDAASTKRALAVCDGVVLQVADFQPDIMKSIAIAMYAGLRIAIIETREEHEGAWLDLIKATARASVIHVRVRPGAAYRDYNAEKAAREAKP